MAERLRTVRARDGRNLGVAQWGDPDGRPVLSLHGTPGCRLNRPPDEDALNRGGLRIITYDRPGYGASDRARGRRIVDCVQDAEDVLEALGVGRFAVSGGSGGGPHALAVAARLGDRVVRAECAVSPAPVDALGADWSTGMDPENVKELGWAQQGEEVLQRELSRLAREDLERMSADPTKVFSDDWEFGDSDRQVLSRPDIQQVLLESFQEALRDGVWGWVDDDLALLAPWGFDVEQIRTPVTVRYGEQDVMVPAAHGAWLAAHIPGADVVKEEGAGHLPDPERRVEELVELAADVPRGQSSSR